MANYLMKDLTLTGSWDSFHRPEIGKVIWNIPVKLAIILGIFPQQIRLVGVMESRITQPCRKESLNSRQIVVKPGIHIPSAFPFDIGQSERSFILNL